MVKTRHSLYLIVWVLFIYPLGLRSQQHKIMSWRSDRGTNPLLYLTLDSIFNPKHVVPNAPVAWMQSYLPYDLATYDAIFWSRYTSNQDTLALEDQDSLASYVLAGHPLYIETDHPEEAFSNKNR